MKTKFNGVLTLFLALLVQITFAQEKTISGIISDESGPLPGAMVLKKGTNVSAETNFDGKYAIKAKNGDVLIFSFVGMKTTTKTVNTSNSINIFMTSDNVLNEIIVSGVAGGTSRKKLSVSVAKVSANRLEDAPVSSAASALQGKVAGVSVTNLGQPGQGANIILRGAKNLYGSQEPLYIVDGAFVEGGLSDMNVDDIASFEIVKGASASALYGSRAGNGVIVISTKRGKVGKTEVTIRSSIGFQELGNKMDLNKSHAYTLASDWESAKGIYTKYDGVTYPANYNGIRSSAVIGGRSLDTDQYADNPYGKYSDFQDDFFRKGFNRTLYTSVSSGSEKARLLFSYENSNVEGILVETKGYDRNSFRFNGDFEINDWLSFNTSNNLISTVDNTPPNDDDLYRSAIRLNPDVYVFEQNPDGQPYYYFPDQWQSELTNPLYDLYSTERTRRTRKFTGSYKLNIKLNDYLDLDGEYAFENIDSKLSRLNPYTSFTKTADPVGFGYSKGGLYESFSNRLTQKAQLTLNFKKSWNDLNLKSKISYLIEDGKYEFFEANGIDFLYPGIPSLDNFDPSNVSSGSDKTDERAKNFFAIVGLDYKDRYIFDAMYRRDGSSLFGENNQWASYYRVSGAYRITKDIDIPGVQELKVHSAYGTSGQRPGFNWQYEQVGISDGILSTDRTKGNPNLKPSKTTELEIGLNASFLDRFNLEAVYSKSKTEDQFMLVDLFSPANAGFNQQWQNVGTVDFNTIEATLNANVIKTDDLSWDVGVNFSMSNNQITALNVSQQKVGPNDLFLIKEGEEFGSMYGRKFVTTLDQMAQQLPTGNSITDYSVNSDGIVVLKSSIGTTTEAATALVDANGTAVSEKIGNQNADFNLGLNSSLKYKGFKFYMLWDWKKGGDVYNRNNQWITIDGRSAMVDQAGKNAANKKTIPYYESLYDTNNSNAFWVEDGSYVKLREASIAYSFDESQLNKIAKGFFKSLKLTLSGQNLLTFTDYKGWDPEVSTFSTDTQQYFSVDYGVYPVSRSYSLAVQLKF
ncbi:SusC/RagA family TonB-linked outer membrane protein [Tenacibaculum haliotis]|uniref:SusC/RagA family TonB-linked outer membrane protein n=1 Tax=Tenacibaculum haliotis TaxID=1888914 RepID=UPI0021AF62E3|nr:SusC/RagA family TonB-linked outer membrane protein [Tenacibaculum haliotis]MCT4697868.1 SusC/RagA family TonB-linked outer membrane protein [Tenacibaculum haliotis]